MDLAKAKSFMFDDSFRTGYIYTSKSIDTILKQSDKSLISVFAICPTASGDKLFYMDWSYSKDPIIMGSFLHLDFFKDAYSTKKWIDLDKR